MKALINTILSYIRAVLCVLRTHPISIIGLIIVTMVVSIGIFGPWLIPYDPYKADLDAITQPPSLQHPFGTDAVGRDVFSRVVWGIRISLIVATGSVLIGLSIGGLSGTIAGFYGKALDIAVGGIFDLLYSFPMELFAIALMVSFGQTLVNVMLSVGIALSPIYCRVVRSAVLVVKSQAFIEAARSFGATDFDVITHHIIPNIATPTIVIATTTYVWAILVEAGLSFLGVGVPASIPTLGTIVANGRNFLASAPWIVYSSGLVIFLVVLGFNLLGDGLRDYIDPYTREKR